MAELPIALPPEGLSESRFGLRYYIPEIHVLVEVVELRRKSGELWGELTVKCNLEGVRTPGPDGNRMIQGNFNFSSVTTRSTWGKRLKELTPEELNARMEWSNVLDRVAMAVLDHERSGSLHGHEITGKRMDHGGRPWAAWPVWPANEMATLFARGGAGKTSLVASIVFGMAQGRSIVPGIRVDRPYRVAVLDWETNGDTYDDILGLISETNHLPVPTGIWYEPMEVQLERSVPKISNLLDKHRADAVVIDSVTMSLMSSAEHSDPAEAITRSYQVLRGIGAWGLLIDHIAAGENDSQRVARKAYGSVFKGNIARHNMGLHVRNRFGATSETFLYCPKSNVGADRWAMAGTFIRSDTELRWAFGEPDYDLFDRLTHVGSAENPESELTTSQGAIRYLNYFSEMDAAEGVATSQFTAAFGLSDGGSRAALLRMLSEGLIEKIQSGRGRGNEARWRISDVGSAVIGRPDSSD